MDMSPDSGYAYLSLLSFSLLQQTCLPSKLIRTRN